MSKPRFGALIRDGGVSFRVWAPVLSEMAIAMVEGSGADPPLRDIAMHKQDDGFFVVDVPGARAGQRYWLRTAHGLRPDPASRFQPEGPLGPSQLVEPRAFEWTDHDWGGAGAAHRHVIYEMHIGTFTAEGTWQAAGDRLPRLAAMGVTTLEVMPVSEFAGRFGWGYDGVQMFAPSHLYGCPDDAKRFVDRAHHLGLAVILDVVYNHFGPVGNYMKEFAPSFFGAAGEWGDLFNFDGPGAAEVRAFVVENASHWIEDYHFDGLRLDATQAIKDGSAEHIVSEISRAARTAAGRRSVFLVGESEPQDARLLKASGAFADGLDAIWNEDWHHAAYVCATGRRQAYFTDYLGSAPEFASMARHGFLYQGQWYTWQTSTRGGYAMGLPHSSFVNFLENHDQVANTGLGRRLHQMVDPACWRALTALLLLGPALPMLFQGQEFGSSKPFIYFADHDDVVAKAAEAGRLQFLSQFPGLAQPAMRARLPRPGDPDMFERCRLLDAERNADGPMVRLHADLLSLRKADRVLQWLGTARVSVDSSAPAPSIVLIRYFTEAAHRLLVVNVGDDHLSPMNDPLFAPKPGTRWVLQWSSEDPRYEGGGAIPFVEAGRWLIFGSSAALLRSA